METMQNSCRAAVRTVCQSGRGTIACEVAAGVAAGTKCLIEQRGAFLYLVRVLDGFAVKMDSNFDLRRLAVSEATAERLSTIAADIRREAEICSEVALLRFEQKQARKVGRWSDGTFRTRGAAAR